jgi:hypothetical protein
LPQAVQNMLMENKLDMGHARLVAAGGRQQITANKIVLEGLPCAKRKLVQKQTAAGKQAKKAHKLVATPSGCRRNERMARNPRGN